MKFGDFYLILCEIINIITDTIISNVQINFLKGLIISHHEMYIRLFHDHLKPKFHFMVHYPEIIRRMGPFKSLSSIRYEGFHNISKNYASNIKEKYNINISDQIAIAFLL